MVGRPVGRQVQVSTFLLIHGAWHGAWCWRRLTPVLEGTGHRVITPDLPGHGSDNTPIAEIGLSAYVNKITGVLDNLDEQVILVGHSMAGIVISEVAEHRPDKMSKLVYLAAFLPGNGDSLLRMESNNPYSSVTSNLVPSDDGLTATLNAGCINDLFYNDCSDADRAFANANLCPQPLSVLKSPVKITEQNYGRTVRIYIECSEDRVIRHEYQKIMIDTSPVHESIILDSGHSPFFSMPEKLADILISIAG